MKYALAASLLLGSTALAAPSPPGHDAAPAPNAPGIGKRPCSQAEIALATGIHLNINAQYGEFNGTKKVEAAEQAFPVGPNPDIYKAIGMLQADVQEGMNIRLFNQQIAPPGNPAIPGLQKYAMAQETEKAQAQGLTGIYKIDKPVFAKLKTEIQQGIQLNEMNLKAAVSQCDFTLVFPPENEMGS